MVGHNFEASLAALVEQVWGDLRDTPNRVSADAIYRRYASGQNGREAPLDQKALEVFLDKIDGLLDAQSTFTSQVQTADDWLSYKDFRAAGPSDLSATDVDIEVGEWMDAAWSSFYHFKFVEPETPPATHRVYLSTSSLAWSGPALMGHVLRAAEDAPALVRSAKLIGPGGRNRQDHLVVYCASRAGQEHVVARVLEHPQLLGRTNPAATQMLVTGIGVADEPPRLGDEEGEITRSHGSVMARIIWRVAKQFATSSGPAVPPLDIFSALVYSEFVEWNIDPREPHWTEDARAPKSERRRHHDDPPRLGSGAGPGMRSAISPALRAALGG